MYNKKDLMKDLIAEKDTFCFKNFYSLLQLLLDEYRVMNDTANIIDVPKIQGKIELLKGLLKDLTPQLNQKKTYDGGFGE